MDIQYSIAISSMALTLVNEVEQSQLYLMRFPHRPTCGFLIVLPSFVLLILLLKSCMPDRISADWR